MTEMPAAWERALRAGPPDESGYVVRAILVTSHDEIPADASSLATERVVPLAAVRRPVSNLRREVVGWALLSAAASLVIGLVVGRATAPVPTGGPAARSPETPLVRTAFVDERLMNAWTRATMNLNGSSTIWMVCDGDPVLGCDTVSATDLGRAADSAPGGLSPSLPVRAYWSRLHPIAISAGHVAGAFAIAIGAGQIGGFEARLIALDGPGGSPGIEIDTVASGTPGYFFDLGTVAPGSYALVIATNPTSPSSELYAAGLVVRNR